MNVFSFYIKLCKNNSLAFQRLNFNQLNLYKPNINFFSSNYVIKLISSGEKSSLNYKSNEDATEALQKKIQDDMPIEMVNPYERKRDVCILCKYNINLDYKNPKLLSQFISPYTGQLYDRHITRLCAKQQKLLEREIKKSRVAGYMAVMVKSVEYLKDPQLFDPNRPMRPHKY